MKILKYVITNQNEPILFSKNVLHCDIRNDIIRAGFAIIFIDIKQMKFKVTCFGESSTLKLKLDISKDKIIIESFLNQI